MLQYLKIFQSCQILSTTLDSPLLCLFQSSLCNTFFQHVLTCWGLLASECFTALLNHANNHYMYLKKGPYHSIINIIMEEIWNSCLTYSLSMLNSYFTLMWSTIWLYSFLALNLSTTLARKFTLRFVALPCLVLPLPFLVWIAPNLDKRGKKNSFHPSIIYSSWLVASSYF